MKNSIFIKIFGLPLTALIVGGCFFFLTSASSVEHSNNESLAQLSADIAKKKAELNALKTAKSETVISSDPFIGEISMFAGNFAPRGWAFCDGQLLPISQNQALFSILGTIYGGDGRTSFAVPDLRGRSAVSFGQGPGLTPIRLGQRRGTEFVTQTISQMAPHTHNATFKATGSGLTTEVKASTANATKSVPAAGDFIAAPGNIGRSPQPSAGFIAAANVGTTVALGGVSGISGGTVTVDSSGQGIKQHNLPPQLGLRYCMSITGLFPSRP